MTTDTIKIVDLLPWSDPKNVKTGKGVKAVREAEPDEAFWELWRERKDDLKAFGVSVSKWEGKWKVTWWLPEEAPQIVELPPEPEWVEPPLPDIGAIAAKLLPWQPEGAARLLRTMMVNRCGIDGSDLGVGKTYMALAAYCAAGAPGLLVVCTKSGVHGWHEAMARFGVEGEVINWESIRTGNTRLVDRTDQRWLDRNGKERRTVSFQWRLKRNVWIIFDEVHKAKNPKTVNCSLVIAAKDAGNPVLMMSATAAENPLDMKATGYVLGLYKDPKFFWDWTRSYKCRETQYGWQFFGGADVLARLHSQIFKRGLGNRIRKDANPHFPEQQIIAEPLDMDSSDSIAAAYKEMEAELDAIEEKKASDKLKARDAAAAKLTAMIRARQRIEMLKVPLFVELAEDLIDQGYSVPVTFNFTESLLAFAKKTGFPVINGDTTDAERKRIMADFQADKVRGVAGQMQAISESINLQDLHGNHPRVSLISPTWNARDMLQFFGRTHRAKARTKVTHRIIFAAGTVEEDQAEAVQRKSDNITTLNDGDLSAGLKLI